MGFYWGKNAYLKDSWNVLDFVIVFFSILTMILDYIVSQLGEKSVDISFVRGFRALRALRPLRVVSKSEGKSFLIAFTYFRYQNCGKLTSSEYSISAQCYAYYSPFLARLWNSWSSNL